MKFDECLQFFYPHGITNRNYELKSRTSGILHSGTDTQNLKVIKQNLIDCERNLVYKVHILTYLDDIFNH